MSEKMYPEIKAKWVAALRSGKYQQGRGGLRNGDKFCCLGVLCDLNDPDWVDTGDGEVYGYKLMPVFDMPPKSVYAWAGCDFSEAAVTIADRALTVADHNDEGRTFAEIADAIEAQL